MLGHDIGHITPRHSVAMMSRAQLAQLGLGIGSMISPSAAQFGDLATGGLQEAADKFFGQQGVTAARVGSQNVNGLAAIVGNFEA